MSPAARTAPSSAPISMTASIAASNLGETMLNNPSVPK
jgi:hypothetical protein